MTARQTELDSSPELDDGISSEQLAASALVIAAMAVAATWGFRTVFVSAGYLVQSVIGAALGALVVLAAQRWRLLVGEVIALAIIVPLVAGPIASIGLGFYEGVVSGWVDVLTGSPPLDLSAELRALPFVTAFFGALIGVELARVRGLPGLGIVGPLAGLTLTALFTNQTRSGALAVGLFLLVGLLVLARLHRTQFTNTGIIALGLLIALASVAASGAGLVLGVADETERFDLRDLQPPPWDPLALPSPLSEVKANLKQIDEVDEQPVLRVTGKDPIHRWRLASLPTYNGIYWSVADADAPVDFVTVDSTLPAVVDEVGAGESVRFDVEVLADLGVWVPSAGIPETITFRNETDTRMNVETGTVGVPGTLEVGDSYALTARRWADLSDSELAEVVFTPDDKAAELELLPPVVRNLAADFSTGLAQLSGQRIIAIRDNLRLGSYDVQTPPGHSFGRVAEFLATVRSVGQDRDESDLRPLRGYDELYSATAAVLARLSDIPSRVAVGYVMPEDRWVGATAEIYASDMTAWVEVRIDGVGWVPVDVTPDRSREPQDVEESEVRQGAPVPNPPEPPPAPNEDEGPEITEPEEEEPPEPEEEEQELDDGVGLDAVAVVLASVLAPIAILLAIGLLLIGWKYARRRRRQNAATADARVHGAWAEFIDRVSEAGGTELSPSATPAEIAGQATEQLPGLSTPEMTERAHRLAEAVSSSAFHPDPPSKAVADLAWQDYEELADGVQGSVGVVGRVRQKLDPRPLFDDATASR